MKLLIMGRPGAGKGTQAVKIKEYYNIPHISTGDMFRQAIKKQTNLGLTAQEYMNKGLFVPDELTIGIVKERLSEPDCKGGFLLDGFPRNLVQAKELDKILDEAGVKLDGVLDINVDGQILIDRMVGRRVCKTCGASFHVLYNKPKVEGVCDNCGGALIQRADDTLETAQNRLKVYDDNTAPLLEYYREKKLLLSVDGNQEVSKVFEDIKEVLSK